MRGAADLTICRSWSAVMVTTSFASAELGSEGEDARGREERPEAAAPAVGKDCESFTGAAVEAEEAAAAVDAAAIGNRFLAEVAADDATEGAADAAGATPAADAAAMGG